MLHVCTRSVLQSLIVNYYHKFLKSVRAVLKPLYELLYSQALPGIGDCLNNVHSKHRKYYYSLESASSIQL